MKINKIYNFAIFAVFAGLFLTASAQAATFTVDRTDDANVSACTAAEPMTALYAERLRRQMRHSQAQSFI